LVAESPCEPVGEFNVARSKADPPRRCAVGWHLWLEAATKERLLMASSRIRAKFPEPVIAGSVAIGACSRLTLRDLRSHLSRKFGREFVASVRDITKRSALLGGRAEAEPPAAADRGRDAGLVKCA